MSIRNLDALFKPRAIALFGADNRDDSPGGVLARNLFAGGFLGPILPVHPTAIAIRGVMAFKSVADLPLPPDLAVIAGPAEGIPALIEELGNRGTRAVIVLSTDTDKYADGEGRTLRQRMLEAAKPFTLRIVGPAGLGLIVPESGVNASFAPAMPTAGNLAFITQSASMMAAMLDLAINRSIGFTAMASLGDMTDVDFGDLLDYLAFDAKTRSILLCIDTIANARKFMSAARAASRLKPVIVFDAGRLDGDERLLGGDELGVDQTAVYEAAFRRAGMLPVATIPELEAAARTLATQTRIRGDRLAIVGNGRAFADIAGDSWRRLGGRLAELSAPTVTALDAMLPSGWRRRNPVNVFNDATAERFATTTETVLADEGCDGLLVIHCPTAVGATLTAASAIAAHLDGTRRAKPVTAIWLESRTQAAAATIYGEKNVPLHSTTRQATSALMQQLIYRRNQELLMETPASTSAMFVRDLPRARAVIAQALAAGRVRLSAGEAADLLGAYGFTVQANGGTTGAYTLWLGILTEVGFGPVVVFGHGGSPIAIRQDHAVGLPPQTMTLARVMMNETRVYRLIEADPAMPPSIRDELALAIVKLAQLAAEIGEVVELRINPLKAGPDGLVLGAAEVRLAASDRPAAERLAIRPYPSELERRVKSRSGKELLLRPLRPEDEPALRQLFREMAPEDLRLRFFSNVKEVDQRTLARLTQLDYAREMAFLIEDPTTPETDIWGVMRISADADNARGEYAGAVRSNLKGQGLGRLLMEEIIAYARRRGMGEVWGEVLAENTPMLSLVRSLGFEIQADPQEPSIHHVRLRLTP